MRIHLNSNQPVPKINIFRGSKQESLTDGTIDVRAIASEPIKEIHNKYKNTSAATIAALGTVVLLFTLSRGFQKNANQFLNKVKEFLETRLARTSINDSKKQKSFYEFFIRRINSFTHKLESVNNITSLKDILFMKLMYKTKPTKKLHEAITEYFEKVSEKTVLKSYEKTEEQFRKMNKIFDELDEYIIKNSANDIVEYKEREMTEQGIKEKIVKCTKAELVSKAKNLREMSNLMVMGFTHKSTLKYRYGQINEATSSLYSKFWDASFKDFWSKNNKFKRKEMWQTFIAAEQIKFNKIEMADASAKARNAISYSDADQNSKISEYIAALDNLIPAKDIKAIEIINKLQWFTRHPDVLRDNKKLFFEELNKLKEHKFTHITDEKIAQATEKYKQDNIKHIDKQINDNEPGMFQTMLEYYYEMAKKKKKKSGALLSLKKAVKYFDKSVDLEGNEFFDKVRDLRLGSAPTDVLTVVLSFITLSLGLGHAQDKDKRTSIMLKSGIPVAGGIATAMYSAARLVSGGKSIMLGLLSGIILNQLGIIADNVRKSIKENQSDKTAA